MATKKVGAKAKKAPRVKGHAQIVYFPGDKLELLKRIQVRAKSEKKAINELVLPVLERAF